MNRKMLLRASLALVLSVSFTAFAPRAQAGVNIGLSITVAPPILPVYVQPPLPAPGYIWTPGYWAWGPDGYYWVPGDWVMPPRIGFLWTPGYWGWNGGFYFWHAGYWGPTIGFYGGVNYGFGYTGLGYQGGYWRGGAWYYNRDCNRFAPGVQVTNVYQRTVVNNVTINNRVSYNGGAGGIMRQPNREELAAARGPHMAFTADQQRNQQLAGRDRRFLASVNHGSPPAMNLAKPTARPASFGPQGRSGDRPGGMPGSMVRERTDRPPGAAQHRAMTGMPQPAAARGESASVRGGVSRGPMIHGAEPGARYDAREARREPRGEMRPSPIRSSTQAMPHQAYPMRAPERAAPPMRAPQMRSYEGGRSEGGRSMPMNHGRPEGAPRGEPRGHERERR